MSDQDFTKRFSQLGARLHQRFMTIDSLKWLMPHGSYADLIRDANEMSRHTRARGRR